MYIFNPSEPVLAVESLAVVAAAFVRTALPVESALSLLT